MLFPTLCFDLFYRVPHTSLPLKMLPLRVKGEWLDHLGTSSCLLMCCWKFAMKCGFQTQGTRSVLLLGVGIYFLSLCSLHHLYSVIQGVKRMPAKG